MKGKKILFLTLALLLPVIIFIFLKMFGRNEFSVPALYQDGELTSPENCNFNYRIPYSIPDTISAQLQLNPKDSLHVIYFEPGLRDQLKRVSVEFSSARIQIIAPSDLAGIKDIGGLKECILLMTAKQSVILIDNRRRIRGYYDASDLDEMDRLIIELNVILKRF